MTPTIRAAETPQDYAAFAALCRDYVAWSRERYADLPWFVEEVFGHQALDAELADLAQKYGPPKGRTLLALQEEAAVAGGAWHRLSKGVCEIKRLFVSDKARGSGLGRGLTEALMADAKAAGFRTVRLDTATRLTEAIGLYERLGFERIAAYLDYPERLQPHIVFMERAL